MSAYDYLKSIFTSRLLHSIGAIIGTIGVLVVPAAWIAGDGTFLGFTQNTLYINAALIILGALNFRLATIIHFLEEQRDAGQGGAH